MKFLVGAVSMSVSLGLAAAPVPPPPNVAVFRGAITLESVDKFLAEYGTRSELTELAITSEGGDVRAGLKLGRWVRDRRLDVRVRILCYSACANYVFVAGQKKIINPRSFVAWHGDLEQKDFRELVARYDELLNKQKKGDALLEAEQTFLTSKSHEYEYLKKYGAEQAELYKSVGVDSRIGRLGQEPVEYSSDGWAATVRAMTHFGVRDVSAPEGYALPSYFNADPMAAMVNGGPLLVFDVTEEGKIIVLQGK